MSNYLSAILKFIIYFFILNFSGFKFILQINYVIVPFIQFDFCLIYVHLIKKKYFRTCNYIL